MSRRRHAAQSFDERRSAVTESMLRVNKLWRCSSVCWNLSICSNAGNGSARMHPHSAPLHSKPAMAHHKALCSRQELQALWKGDSVFRSTGRQHPTRKMQIDISVHRDCIRSLLVRLGNHMPSQIPISRKSCAFSPTPAYHNSAQSLHDLSCSGVLVIHQRIEVSNVQPQNARSVGHHDSGRRELNRSVFPQRLHVIEECCLTLATQKT